MALYEEDGVTQPEDSLYTAEDTVPVPDTNVGNYSVLKGIASFATDEVVVPDSINFNHFVDSNWRKTVPEQNTIDRSLAAKAASEGNVNIVQQTLDSVANRNRMYGELSTNNANDIRAKLKELTDQAVETTAVRNPSVLFNNTPDEINESTARISSRLSAAATLDKAIQDGKQGVTTFQLLPASFPDPAKIILTRMQGGRRACCGACIPRTTGTCFYRATLMQGG